MNKLLNTQFDEILTQIKNAKQKAYQQINSNLVMLYWNVGKYISRKIVSEQWGKSIIEDLSKYILENNPNIKGFSARNIRTMKQFYETYSYIGEKLPTLLAKTGWSNNRRIMSLKTPEERDFYLNLCSQKKYSARELEHLINTSTFERTLLGDKNLSDAVTQLPQKTTGIFKDSYIFDFLDIPVPHKEKKLQQALVSQLKDFILELGCGFSFIGQEYRLQVGNDAFFIDLLFFHRDLQCLIAFELKTTKFKPEHLGKLEFYLEALDRDVKLQHENPSIGVFNPKKYKYLDEKYQKNQLFG